MEQEQDPRYDADSYADPIDSIPSPSHLESNRAFHESPSNGRSPTGGSYSKMKHSQSPNDNAEDLDCYQDDNYSNPIDLLTPQQQQQQHYDNIYNTPAENPLAHRPTRPNQLPIQGSLNRPMENMSTR